MSKSRIFPVTLKPGERIQAAIDHKLRIIYGAITHITGTITALYVDEYKVRTGPIFKVAAATGSATFYLNDRITTNVATSVDIKQLWICGRNLYFLFNGAATAKAWLLLEQVKNE